MFVTSSTPFINTQASIGLNGVAGGENGGADKNTEVGTVTGQSNSSANTSAETQIGQSNFTPNTSTDTVSISTSQEGKSRENTDVYQDPRLVNTPASDGDAQVATEESDDSSEQSDTQSSKSSSSSDASQGKQLTEEQEKQVEELKKRDAEVRAHEQAHAAVGGQYAGAPSYDYQTGPDGKRYAVGGQVSIDVSEEKDPQDTIQKMQVVKRAALAPAEPSSQDYKVAAEATQKEQVARSDLAKQNAEELRSGSSESTESAEGQQTQSVEAEQSEIQANGQSNFAKNAENGQSNSENSEQTGQSTSTTVSNSTEPFSGGFSQSATLEKVNQYSEIALDKEKPRFSIEA